MLKHFIALCLSLNICYAQQDLKSNFTPLKSSGQLPDIFTQNIRNVVQEDIINLSKKKEKDMGIRSSYVTASNYEIEKIVKSGNALINDEVTVYLNKIADIVLKDNPTLRSQLHIYALKSTIVNAYSYDKGYIFIDIGLIAQAESEAQLAYILCHEISHYTKKHNIENYVEYTKIDKKSYSGRNSEDQIIAKCQYSKEKESEADLEGFKLFENTNYDLNQATKAFDVLQYAHLPFELIEFKKSFLESEYYKIPNYYLLKEVAAIRDNSNEDDTKHTHPNTAKRKQAILDMVANRNNTGRVNCQTDPAQFEYIRDLARLELCRLYLIERDYPNALYAGYILNDKYPLNEYISEIICKSLYGLTLYQNSLVHYDDESYLDEGYPSYKWVESYPQQLYCLLTKMPANEWTFMSLNYIYRQHKIFPNNSILAACSDSLMKLVSSVNWKISDFARVDHGKDNKQKADSILQQSAGSKTELIASMQKVNSLLDNDTTYYRKMYLDLFLKDKEFSSKFPSASKYNVSSVDDNYPDFSRKNNRSKKTKKGAFLYPSIMVNKILLLEPFYLVVDDRKKNEQVQYISSDQKQEMLVNTINECSKRQKFETLYIDPSQLNAVDVDKINDYSILTDWFDEKYDSNQDELNMVLNTNEINKVVEKYATNYVLKMGIVSYTSKKGRKNTYYYNYLFDLKENKMVYRKKESFKHKDSQDLIYAKVYQTIHELKNSK